MEFSRFTGSAKVPPMRLGSAADRIEAHLGERLHPHSAFMIGLVRVMGNVGVLVFWIILAANFILTNLLF